MSKIIGLNHSTKETCHVFFKYKIITSQCHQIHLYNNFLIILENNTAQHAGSALYGGWVDYCQADMSVLYTVYGTEVFDTIFQIHNDNNDLSVVSSNPTRICVCVSIQSPTAPSPITISQLTVVRHLNVCSCCGTEVWNSPIRQCKLVHSILYQSHSTIGSVLLYTNSWKEVHKLNVKFHVSQ